MPEPQSGALYIRLIENQTYETLELVESAYLDIDVEG